jgi:aryl-alcohol dehydrogenase-like predicted oxidoreductase
MRLGLEYVDVFYHHCPDPETPLEETMTRSPGTGRSSALSHIRW